MICCFFGHRDTPDSIRAKLEETIRQLITENPDIEFMVGNQGHFDGMVLSALRKCREDYPALNYHVVLAYEDVATEEFENMHNLFAAILTKGISRQLKRGL